MDLAAHNKNAWNSYVDKKDRWTIPVTELEINNAQNGDWGIVLTPTKPVPHAWFPNLKGLKVLGLAAGGGQQGPILSALGAEVTIFDNSEKQLQQDIATCQKYNLPIKTVQGDMRNLSAFENESFDLIFNPCSILFVDNLQAVWQECFRVLKPNGILLSGLINPLAFQIKEENLQLVYPQPFSDLHSLPKLELEKLIKENEALAFGHSLEAQIGGQLKAGFLLADMFEDDWNGENKLDEFFPAFIATKAVKMA